MRSGDCVLADTTGPCPAAAVMLGAFGTRANAVPPLTFPSTRALPSPSLTGTGTPSKGSKLARGRRRRRVRPEQEGGEGLGAGLGVGVSAVLRARPGSASTLASARYAASLGVPQNVRSVRLEDFGPILAAAALAWRDGDGPEFEGELFCPSCADCARLPGSAL